MAKQKTLLITRPQEDAGQLAAKLEAKGHRVLLAPMMDVRLTETVLPAVTPQAILLTSANGARALAAATKERNIPLITVGEASADAARRQGFKKVTFADPELGGDARGLIAHVARTLNPADGPLIHVCGTKVAGHVSSGLQEQGFTVHTAELYEAVAVKILPPGVLELLRRGGIDAGLFYSPRTARIFLRLCEQHGVEGMLKHLEAFALSENVANVLLDVHLFAEVHTATTPTQEALLALLAEQA